MEKKLLALEDHSAPGASTTVLAVDRGRVNYKQGGAATRRTGNMKNKNGSSVAQANQEKNPIFPGSNFYKDNNHTSGTSSTVKLRKFNTSLAGGSTGGRAGGGAAGYSTSKAGNLSTSSTSAVVQSSKVQKMLQLDFSERVQLAMVSEPVRTKFIKQHLRQLRTSDYLPKVKNWEKLSRRKTPFPISMSAFLSC